MRKTRRAFIKSAGKGAGIISAIAAGGLNASASPKARTTESAVAASVPDPRCVVTGQNRSGKSIVVTHEILKPVTVALMPGVEFYRVWGNDSMTALPSDGTPTPQPTFFPPKNGFRFGMFTLPPATSASAQPPATARQAPTPAELQEAEQKLPGLLEAMEADHPGMHTTDTVDFDVVVSGEVLLELDDGAEVVLKAGDCVIQNGTRHAWHNRSNERCVIAFSLVGANRKRPA
jgi:mannose-6-phosphate isomerase-like protein (cupin superfamily)